MEAFRVNLEGELYQMAKRCQVVNPHRSDLVFYLPLTHFMALDKI